MEEKVRIGKFEIVAPIGSGGMGAVFKALDTVIGRTVALKLMSPEAARNPAARDRFLREARAAGRLQHHNILVIHDVGEVDGTPYIAMEHLDGLSMTAMVPGPRRDAYTVSEKLWLMIQMAAGLHYAHEHGVIHRDIKPSNVMVTRDLTVKIVDFGIARLEDQRVTNTGDVMGTIFYMSPEQLRGAEIDRRADVYSAGVMLYELLTGHVPFEGENTTATLLKIITEPPPPLSLHLPVSPVELEEIVVTALAKAPEDRYSSAEEFRRALEHAKLVIDHGNDRRGQSPSPLAPPARPGATTMSRPSPRPTANEPAPTIVHSSPAAPAQTLTPIPPAQTASPTQPHRWWQRQILPLAAILVVGLGIAMIVNNARTTAKSDPVQYHEPTTTPVLNSRDLAAISNTQKTIDAANGVAPVALEGTYDLFQGKEVTGEMTVFNQSGSEFAVRAQDWNAQGHISGRDGYYDWRFASGELAGQTGRTTFTVQPNGDLVGKVQGDRPELKWAYLAKPRVRPAEPLAPAGPAALPAAEASDAWLNGTWTGSAHQASTNHDWTIRLVMNWNSYRIAYPSLDCGGSLTPIRRNEAYATFLEHIETGTANCVDGGTVTLTRYTNGEIEFTWEGSGDRVSTRLRKQ